MRLSGVEVDRRLSHPLQIERALEHINTLRAGVIMFCSDHTGRDVGPPHPNFLTLNSLQIVGQQNRPVFGRLLGACDVDCDAHRRSTENQSDGKEFERLRS